MNQQTGEPSLCLQTRAIATAPQTATGKLREKLFLKSRGDQPGSGAGTKGPVPPGARMFLPARWLTSPGSYIAYSLLLYYYFPSGSSRIINVRVKKNTHTYMFIKLYIYIYRSKQKKLLISNVVR